MLTKIQVQVSLDPSTSFPHTKTFFNFQRNEPHHGKTVADPERGPASWAVGDRDALTMHGDNVGGNFTDDASMRRNSE